MKKTSIIILLALFPGLNVSAQHTLTVKVNNLSAKKGILEAGLFNKKEGFLKPGNHLMKKREKISGNTATITFGNIPKGNYAVAIFQDENLNNKCDTNFMGIPLEGYGFSNNVKPVISAPDFEQTQFLVDGNKNIEISLIR